MVLLPSLVTALSERVLRRIDHAVERRRRPELDVVEGSDDENLAVELGVFANRRGQREATLTVELDVRGVGGPVARLLALRGTTTTGLREALLALTSELSGRPQSDAPLAVGAEVAAAFELGAESRGQDQSALGIQRVLKLTDEPEHLRLPGDSHGPHFVTQYTTFHPNSPDSPTTWAQPPPGPTTDVTGRDEAQIQAAQRYKVGEGPTAHCPEAASTRSTADASMPRDVTVW